MLSTFVIAYDVAYHKDDSKSVAAIADSYIKHMGWIDKSGQILYAYLDERKSLQWTKNFDFADATCYEFLYTLQTEYKKSF